MSAPRVVNTVDGTVWTRREATRDGQALYAIADCAGCPEFVMVTYAELEERGIAGAVDALPVPVAPEPQALPVVLTEAQVEALAAAGNRVVNDETHERLCMCDAWPKSCVSTGHYFMGAWDVDGLEAALPAVLGLWESMRGGELEKLRAQVAEFGALELGAPDGRVSAACGNPEHPTWLRRPDDARACPWCAVAELEAQRERRRVRLVALQNDALSMRGSLSPNGEASKVPFPLGETLTPAVDWLIGRVAELEAERAEAVDVSESLSRTLHEEMLAGSALYAALTLPTTPEQRQAALDRFTAVAARVGQVHAPSVPVVSPREREPEFHAWLHHENRVSHDLPETGGADRG